MSFFYDPIKKKVQPWLPIAFILVPILFIGFGFVLAQNYVKNKAVKVEDQENTKDKDIFDAPPK